MTLLHLRLIGIYFRVHLSLSWGRCAGLLVKAKALKEAYLNLNSTNNIVQKLSETPVTNLGQSESWLGGDCGGN